MGRIKEGLAVAGHGRSTCRHSGYESGGEEDNPDRTSDRIEQTDDLPSPGLVRSKAKPRSSLRTRVCVAKVGIEKLVRFPAMS